MCGRFTVTTKDTKKVADRFQVELEKALERNAAGEAPPPTQGAGEEGREGLGRFNVAPTQEVLTVRSSPDPEEAAQGEREARLMRWGLVPRWAKDLKVGYRMINAKAENLTSSRAYAPAGRQVPPPLPDRRRRLLRVDEGRGPQAAAPALALHRRRRRAVRLRRHLHPQGVGGRGGARRRGRLALQLHDRHDDAERGRRQGPRPDAGDPARPRGRGGLAAPRPRASRTRSRCARRWTPRGWRAPPPTRS